MADPITTSLLIGGLSAGATVAASKAAQGSASTPTVQPTTPMPTYRDEDYARARADAVSARSRGKGRSGTDLSGGDRSAVNPVYTNTALGQ